MCSPPSHSPPEPRTAGQGVWGEGTLPSQLPGVDPGVQAHLPLGGSSYGRALVCSLPGSLQLQLELGPCKRLLLGSSSPAPPCSQGPTSLTPPSRTLQWLQLQTPQSSQ